MTKSRGLHCHAKDPKDRLQYYLSRCKKNTETGCLEWTGAFGSSKRNKIHYPAISWRSRDWHGHRLIWTMVNGVIPEGLCVLHNCDNPKCLNVAHLRVGTQKDNLMDMFTRKRSNHQKKTHCPKGHPYSKENTYRYKASRFCIACSRDKETKRRKRRAFLACLRFRKTVLLLSEYNKKPDSW